MWLIGVAACLQAALRLQLFANADDGFACGGIIILFYFILSHQPAQIACRHLRNEQYENIYWPTGQHKVIKTSYV